MNNGSSNPILDLGESPVSQDEPLEDISPWASLDDCTIPGLKKLANQLRSSFPDPETGSNVPTFGSAAIKVSDEILDYIACKEGRMRKKGDRKVKKIAPQKTDTGDMAVITRFIAQCKEHIGTPPLINYGRDRKLIQQVIQQGYSVETLCDLVDMFFEHKNTGFIFRDGNILSFTKAIIPLAAKQKPSITVERQISVPADQLFNDDPPNRYGSQTPKDDGLLDFD